MFRRSWKISFTEFSDVWFTSKRPLGYDVVRMIMFALKDRHSPAITYKAGIGLKITIGNIIGHRHFCIHTGRTTRRGRNSTATGRILYHLSGRSVISQEEDNQPKTQKQEKRIWGRDYAVPLRRVLRSSLAKRKKNKSQLVRNKANREGTDLFHWLSFVHHRYYKQFLYIFQSVPFKISSSCYSY